MTKKYRSLEHTALEVLSGKELRMPSKRKIPTILETPETLLVQEINESSLQEDKVTGKSKKIVFDPNDPDRRKEEIKVTNRIQFQTPARLAANKKRIEKAAAKKAEEEANGKAFGAVQESLSEEVIDLNEERKISSAAAHSFMNHRPYKNKNTHVVVTPHGTEMRLHGNLIAKNVKGKVSISMAGWPTTTTKSRLNSLGVNVRTKGGKHYLGNKEIDSKSWYTLGESHVTENKIGDLELDPDDSKKKAQLDALKKRGPEPKHPKLRPPSPAKAAAFAAIDNTDWSNKRYLNIRKKDPKFAAYLEKKGLGGLTENSVVDDISYGLKKDLKNVVNPVKDSIKRRSRTWLSKAADDVGTGLKGDRDAILTPIVDAIKRREGPWAGPAFDDIRTGLKRDAIGTMEKIKTLIQGEANKNRRARDTSPAPYHKRRIKESLNSSELTEGLIRTLNRGKGELPKMIDHRLKGQFSESLLAAVRKVVSENKPAIKDPWADGVKKSAGVLMENTAADRISSELNEASLSGLKKKLAGTKNKKERAELIKAIAAASNAKKAEKKNPPKEKEVPKKVTSGDSERTPLDDLLRLPKPVISALRTKYNPSDRQKAQEFLRNQKFSQKSLDHVESGKKIPEGKPKRGITLPKVSMTESKLYGILGYIPSKNKK